MGDKQPTQASSSSTEDSGLCFLNSDTLKMIRVKLPGTTVMCLHCVLSLECEMAWGGGRESIVSGGSIPVSASREPGPRAYFSLESSIPLPP